MANIVQQIVSLLLLFFVRAVLVREMGIEYQGLDALMMSIVSILSLLDLGIGTASVYSLYEPLAAKDHNRIRALIKLYRNIYTVLILVFVLTGTVFAFFVPFLLKNSVFTDSYIRTVFFFFLVQMASTYLFAEYSSLLLADEKNYFNSLYRTITTVICAGVQIVVIIVLENYLAKIAVVTVGNIAANCLIRHKALSLYYYLRSRTDIQLPENGKRLLFQDLKNLSISRIADALIFQTDNVFISALIGEIQVGIYSNYITIFNGVNGLINCIVVVLQPTLKNILIKNGDNKCSQYEILSYCTAIGSIIVSFCVCVYYFVLDDFIGLWVGQSYTLTRLTTLLMVTTQLIILLDTPIWMMMSINGRFKEIKSIGLTAAIINVLLSLVLGYVIGIDGIVIGTVACYIFSFLAHLIFVFKYLCPESRMIIIYINRALKAVIITIITVVICNRVINITWVGQTASVLNIIYKGILCFAVIVSINVLVNRKDIKLLLYQKPWKVN